MNTGKPLNTERQSLISSIFGAGSIYQNLNDDEHGSGTVGQDLNEDQPPLKATKLHSQALIEDEEMSIGVQEQSRPSYKAPLSSDNDSDSESEIDPVPISLGEPPPQNAWRDEESEQEDDETPQRLLIEEPSPEILAQPNRDRGHDIHSRRRGPTIHRFGKNKGQQPGLLDLIDPKERALWKWSNVENLDVFLQEIYSYFLDNGFYCILLSRIVSMATIVFVVGFSTYLYSCIDYSKIRSSSRLEDVQIPRCMAKTSAFHKFTLWIFALFWFMKLFQYVRDVRALQDLRDFYYYLLDVSDSDMQTISWQEIVTRLQKLKTWNLAAANTSRPQRQSKRLDAHDVANRIMRKENYMIALINQDILDLRVPLPYFKHYRHFFTRILEWNIGLCIMDFVFNSQGQLRPIFLKEEHRQVLSGGLRRRFIFTGFMNIICAPFIIIYLTLLYFFRYFNEYHRDPSAIGFRQYSPYAEWKMREYNELYHLFQRRLNMSYLPASMYIDQFPKEMTAIFFRFVAFVAGSFAAVLGIISLIDPELFLGFEISKDRTVLFYIGVFGTILAISRGMIPSETLVFDPEASMRQVAEFTHYLPPDWHGKLHSEYVKQEFGSLYQMRIVLLLKELASVVVAPFILWFSLPNSCDRIVDFFRANSVHVDGLGYVCSYALFNFDKRGNLTQTNRDDREEESANAKMMKSYFNFMNDYKGNPLYRNTAVIQRPITQSRLGTGSSRHETDKLELSVMDRYNKWHEKQHRPGAQSMIYRPASKGQVHESRAVMPLVEREEDGTFESALSKEDDDSVTQGLMDNGGVLGLLNQFYQHSNSNKRLG